jgi:deoxycytidine triphosphate deaminase
MKTISPYMMALHKELKDSRGIADQTASQYIRTLYSLNSDRSFNNLAWLKNVESVELRLSEYAESTQKTMLSTIVSALSSLNQKSSYKKIFAYWYNRMMDKSNEARNVDSSVKTPKQEQNWLSWDIILAHENRLSEESEKIVKQKVLSVADWNTLLSYMLLSLYTKFAPRRNQDYQFMKVVKSEKQATNLDFNYYITDKHEFVFNKYKTAKAHGEQRFEVPSDLVAVIDLYLKKHPGVSKSPYFFLVNHDDTPLPSVNSVTRILNRIFGKNVGTTMLRHIYLSSKYDVAEMNKDSEQMGHTAGMQREYMKAETVNVPTL